jgi:hypothetical protein
MPCYHFNVQNGTGFVEDEEGRDLPDLDAVRSEALTGIRSILAEDVRRGFLDLRGRIEIVDEAGARVLIVPFADAVDVKGSAGG